MTTPPSSPDDHQGLPAWCFAKFNDIEDAMHELTIKDTERLRVLERKIDDLTDALTGDVLHPNGLVTDVQKLKVQMVHLEREWDRFMERARGFGIGIAIGAGMTGGGVAALLLKLLGA